MWNVLSDIQGRYQPRGWISRLELGGRGLGWNPRVWVQPDLIPKELREGGEQDRTLRTWGWKHELVHKTEDWGLRKRDKSPGCRVQMKKCFQRRERPPVSGVARKSSTMRTINYPLVKCERVSGEFGETQAEIHSLKAMRWRKEDCDDTFRNWEVTSVAQRVFGEQGNTSSRWRK